MVRPRLYERKPETLTAPLFDMLEAIDVSYVQGSAETVDTKSKLVKIANANGTKKSLSYDRLVVTTGSRLFRPNIPGLAEHGFSVDSLDDAITLDKHLHGLAKRPATTGRDTVVVAGGGFTGIEAATEMPARLREILGTSAKTRVIIVERNDAIAPDMGAGPGRSSRKPCARSAWRHGSAPVSPRSMNPASRCRVASTSKPRP